MCYSERGGLRRATYAKIPAWARIPLIDAKEILLPWRSRICYWMTFFKRCPSPLAIWITDALIPGVNLYDLRSHFLGMMVLCFQNLLLTLHIVDDEKCNLLAYYERVSPARSLSKMILVLSITDSFEFFPIACIILNEVSGKLNQKILF